MQTSSSMSLQIWFHKEKNRFFVCLLIQKDKKCLKGLKQEAENLEKK